ncbi:ATP-binding protein [Pseudoduganella chitinolytica]|uniref:histidine kinase n=1 Tax=Pseudoduganella chitinolytica TaxID=34070 RepID=A0ABY8BFT0_9BURK|nr:ATP-binding protein [Pseudoduganella chitinolytica]WEF34767.1 ATP-binding protein [Pseudoduganella chitinolytica]
MTAHSLLSGVPPGAGAAEIAVSEYFDGHPVPTFAINAAHVVTHWNRACEHLLGWSKAEMVGTGRHWQAFYKYQRPLLADLIVAGQEDSAELHYPGKWRRSTLIQGGFEAEDFFPNIGPSGHWLHFTAAPLRDHTGRVVGAIETLRDVTERRAAENELRRAHDNLGHLVERRTAQLAEMNEQLQADIRQRHLAEAELRRSNLELTALNGQLLHAQQQLMQADKLASIGHLAAGVAHEINNPIGYIFSNFTTLHTYFDQLLAMLDAYRGAEAVMDGAAALRAMRERIDLDFLRGDIPTLLAESREGIVRVRHIVQDLKDFSRADIHQDWVWANVHQGIDSTLNIVGNEVKYRAEVIKQYGDIPDIECLPVQVNQVIMNLLVNAAHAMGAERGRITVSTGREGDGHIWIDIADSGCGIPADILPRIFDPFFTTKEVGKGTGLGLSLSYGIIQRHSGRIEVESEPDRGSRFRVLLPVHQHAASEDAG